MNRRWLGWVTGAGWLPGSRMVGSLPPFSIPAVPRKPVQLSSGDGRQVTLAAGGDGAVAAVWAHREGRGQYLVAADLVVSESRVAVAHSGPISPSGSSDYQGFPAAVFAGDGHLVVTWEDRRAGHTRIYGARRNASGRFEDERQLNEHNEPDVTESWLANKGTGAMRVAVAAMPDGGLNAIWLDKRSPGSGYAVWGASGDDPGRGFGANIRVQDTLGDAVAQWHASVISGPDGFVALWDDARENWSDENETGDVFLSWRTEGGWSEDLMVPGASGPATRAARSPCSISRGSCTWSGSSGSHSTGTPGSGTCGGPPAADALISPRMFPATQPLPCSTAPCSTWALFKLR